MLDQVFVCPKCGRSHTVEEFKASRFCRNCGKFLTYSSRVNASLVKGQTKPESEWPLFPYDPYPQQLDFMRDVKNVVCNQGVLVAEACNGFGKTVCALATILSMDHKIIYATRTHEQVLQVLLEVEHINQISEAKFRAVILASRQHLCLNEKCRELSAMDASEACRILRKNEECEYKVDVGQLFNLPNVLSIVKLRREGKARMVCPYFLARKAAEGSAVIVAPYQYVFNEHIRSLVKLELSNKVLVFDEAHNADQIGQVLSDALSERALNNAKKELESVDVASEFIDGLTAVLERKVSGEVVIEPGSKLYEDLKAVLQVDELSSFVDPFSEVVDEIRQHKIERGDNPVSYLNGVIRFLSLVESSPRDSYIAVYQKSSYGLNLVKYHCLDPSLAIKPVVDEACGALIMSGTLSPMQLFTEILGLKEAETRTYSAIADPNNVHTMIDPYVTTRFAERGEEMTHRIGERLSGLVAKIPHGVLIFFPQRKFMLNSLDAWKGTALVKGNGSHLLLGGKPVFVEGAQAMENRSVVEAYKNEIRTGGGAVLCGVFRGRNAEGSNFPFEEGGAVVLVGVPYADYSDPIVKAQMNYYNKRRAGLGEKWYVMDAFKAANQAMGRGIRHRDDRCNFILMDRRYLTRQDLISSWVLVNGVQKLSPDYWFSTFSSIFFQP